MRREIRDEMLKDVDSLTKQAIDEQSKPKQVALDTIDFFVPDSEYQDSIIKTTEQVDFIPGTYVLDPQEA